LIQFVRHGWSLEFGGPKTPQWIAIVLVSVVLELREETEKDDENE
jgi:hypothetical protein